MTNIESTINNYWENINYLNKKDEIKFVIGNREDYDWAKNKISE